MTCIIVDDRQEAPQQTGNHQSQRHCEKGGCHEIEQCPESQLSHFRDVVHRKDARHDGEEHQRCHNKLQQVQEDNAKGFDIRIDKAGLVAKQNTCHHCKQQGDTNLGGKGELLHILS